MSDYRFAKGGAYMVTPVLPDAKKIVLACIGRRGRSAIFARVNDTYRVEVVVVDGRETAMIRGKDGLDYFASAAVEVDIARAMEIVAATGAEGVR